MKKIIRFIIYMCLLVLVIGCSETTTDYQGDTNSNSVVLTDNNAANYVSAYATKAAHMGNNVTFTLFLDLGNADSYSSLKVTMHVILTVYFEDLNGNQYSNTWRTTASFANNQTISKSVYYNSSKTIYRITDYDGYMTSVVSASGTIFY